VLRFDSESHGPRYYSRMYDRAAGCALDGEENRYPGCQGGSLIDDGIGIHVITTYGRWHNNCVDKMSESKLVNT
jgi:hypothetical protein